MIASTEKFYFDEGQKMINQNKYQSAFELFEKVIDLNKNYHKAYRNLIKTAKELKKQQQFINNYSEQIITNPHNPVIYVKRGCLYKAQQKYENALRDYTKAIQIDAQYSVVYNFRANILCSVNKYEQAIIDYQKAIQLNPKYWQAYFNKALLYQQKQEWQLAIKNYTKVIQINPNQSDAFYNRGTIYYQKQKQIQKALSDVNKSIQLDPLEDSYYYRGLIHQYKCQFELALKDFDKVIELNPQYLQAYNNRAVIRLDPKYIYARNRTIPFSQEKQYDAALNDYSKIIQINPKVWEWYYNRASIYQKKNELQMAINDMIKVMELHQGSKYLLQIGQWYFKLKKIQLAEAKFMKYKQLNGQHYICYYYLGRIELIKRNLQLASTYLQKSIQLLPDIMPYEYLYKGIVNDLIQESDTANEAYRIAFQQSIDRLKLLRNVYKEIRKFNDDIID